MQDEKPAGQARQEAPATTPFPQNLPDFWKRWGPPITTMVVVLGALVTAGAFLLRQVDALDATATSVEQLQADLRSLKEERLPELRQQYAVLTKSLSSISESLDPEAKVRLENLLDGTEDTRRILDRISTDLDRLEARAQAMPILQEKSERLLSAQQELKDLHRADFSDLRGDVKGLTVDVSKLEALADILKPIIAESVAFGRIDRATLRTFYTDEEIAEFVKDATELVESGKLTGGGGGGGGGGGAGRLGSMTADLNCAGIGKECFKMSVILPPEDRTSTEERVTIGLYSGPRAEKVAQLIRSGQSQEIRLAATTYDGSLCEWAYLFPESLQPAEENRGRATHRGS